MSEKRAFEAAAIAASPTREPPPLKRLKDQDNNKRFVLRQLSANDCCQTQDDIHTTIYLCPVSRAILDTPAFQRLRHIKQLGTAESVFMNANHTRFEHCLGTMHLAEKLARKIQERQPYLQVTDKDVCCVKLGGLLHDIGHGPFSHVYELYILQVFPKYLKEHPEIAVHYDDNMPTLDPKTWKHESVSLMMIDCALECLGLAIDETALDQPLKQIGDGVDAKSMRVFDSRHHCSCNQDKNENDLILTSRDFIFIKECIWGGPLPGYTDFVGRECDSKEWLYNIVSNDHSGLDVDKIDYFARDQRRAFRGAGEIEKLMIDEALVTWAKCTKAPGKCPRCKDVAKNHLMICYPKKMVPRCLDFFKLRFKLFSSIYEHRTVSAAGLLLCDVFCKADPYFRIPASLSFIGNNGKAKREYESLPISRAMLDPATFLQLSDTIIDVLAFDKDPNLHDAKQLIGSNIKHRGLYKCVVDRSINLNSPSERRVWEMTNEQIEDGMFDVVKLGAQHEGQNGVNFTLTKQDYIVDHCAIHHGRKDQNPLNAMRFLEKSLVPDLRGPIENYPEAKVEEESTYEQLLPRSFRHTTIRVYSRDPDKADLVEHVFEQWLDSMHEAAEQTPFPTDEEGYSANPAVLSQESDDGSGQQEMDEQGMIDLQSPQPVQGQLTPKITPPPRKKLTM